MSGLSRGVGSNKDVVAQENADQEETSVKMRSTGRGNNSLFVYFIVYWNNYTKCQVWLIYQFKKQLLLYRKSILCKNTRLRVIYVFVGAHGTLPPGQYYYDGHIFHSLQDQDVCSQG